MKSVHVLCILGLLLVSCADAKHENEPFDVEFIDTSGGDTRSADTGAADTASADTGSADTGSADTAVADTGVTDTNIADTGVADTGSPDTGPADTGPPDVPTPPEAPANLSAQAGTANHSVELSWDAVSGATAYHLYYDTQAITDTSGPKEVLTGTAFTHTTLDLALTYHYRVTAVDAVGESVFSDEVTAQPVLALSGVAEDFKAGDALPGWATDTATFYLTWSDTALFAGVAGDLTSGQDAFLVAIDTDPAVDSAGSNTVSTQGQNNVILPFHADYLVEVQPNTGSTSATLRTWSGSSWTSQALSDTVGGAARFADGDVDAVQVEASELGNPTAIRVALVAYNTTNGFTFAAAPEHPDATHVMGFFASVPGALGIDAPFSAHGTLDAAANLVDAPALITLTVDAAGRSGSGDIQLSSDTRPFSTTLSNAVYALSDDGTHGDITGGDDIYTGVFNLGGVSDAFYFVFNDGTAEATFQRAFTLNGSAQTLARITWGERYADAQGAKITFSVSGAPTGSTVVRGDTAPLDWTTGIAMSDAGGGVQSVEVDFPSVAGPIVYKFFSGNWESFSGDRSIDIDVVGPLLGNPPSTPGRGTLALPSSTWDVK